MPLYAVLLVMPVFAQQASDTRAATIPATGACENATVTNIAYYFQDDPQSGFVVEYSSQLGLGTKEYEGEHRFASIVDRETPPNPVIAREHPGDHVRICLTQFPQKDDRCDPSKDWRGRVYTVYDYRLHEKYSGANANHLCGGA